MRWRTDGHFSYIMRRVPGDRNMSHPYTHMLATHGHPREQMQHYTALEKATELYKWGEDLHLTEEV